ncbi:MAG: cell division protein ZapA [Aestuariivita sp.]|nr:cell division protein ZapA [Aestuariivita sp.]
MPSVMIQVGKCSFEVDCLEGEEQRLNSSVKMLSEEVRKLNNKNDHIFDNRLFVLAGLILADKIIVLEELIAAAKERLVEQESKIRSLQEGFSANTAIPNGAGEIISDDIVDTLIEIAKQSEAMATKLENKMN